MTLFGIDLFLSHSLYGKRPMTHLDAYAKAPGWYQLEVGSWTLEVSVEERPECAILRACAVTLATLYLHGAR